MIFIIKPYYIISSGISKAPVSAIKKSNSATPPGQENVSSVRQNNIKIAKPR
jgi:hypothetical protein